MGKTFPKQAFVFTAVQIDLKQGEKEEVEVTGNFSFSHSVFYPFGELSTISSNSQ